MLLFPPRDKNKYNNSSEPQVLSPRPGPCPRGGRPGRDGRPGPTGPAGVEQLDGLADAGLAAAAAAAAAAGGGGGCTRRGCPCRGGRAAGPAGCGAWAGSWKKNKI